MRKRILSIFFTLCSCLPLYAVEVPEVEKDKDMPENYRVWEQENADREVKEESRFQELWTKTLYLLVIILALIFIATWYMKRTGRFKLNEPNQKSRIQLVEKKVLSPKAMLYLVEIDGQKIALSETAANGVQMLVTIGIRTIESK